MVHVVESRREVDVGQPQLSHDNLRVEASDAVQILPQPTFLFLQAADLVEIAGSLGLTVSFLNGADFGADIVLCFYTPLEIIFV